MSDEVVVVDGDESPDASTEAEATPAFDETTWKKRLAGKDQALTVAVQAKKALEAELEKYRTAQSEREQAEMTEAQRLAAKLAEAEAKAAAAEQKAQRADLARKFPLAFDLLGDAVPLDEVRLAEIEGRLKDEESEGSTFIDPNRTRRSAPRAPGPRTVDQIKEDLRKQAVPTAAGD